MSSLHVICGSGPPNQKSWLRLWSRIQFEPRPRDQDCRKTTSLPEVVEQRQIKRWTNFIIKANETYEKKRE